MFKNWSVIDSVLISDVHHSDSWVYVLLQIIEYSSLCYTVGLCCLSVLYVVYSSVYFIVDGCLGCFQFEILQIVLL